MFLGLLPSLRVHCWGGLGSQLFAWALIEDIKVLYPNRRIKLILHQSGVTKRVEEIAEFFPGEVSIREDFKASNNLIVSQHKGSILTASKNLIKTIFLRILFKLGILCSCDSDTSLSSLRIWTMQIRGHYSYRRITKDVIESMNLRAKKVGKRFLDVSDEVSGDLAIQYRLGDLLTLDKKSPIDPSRLAKSIVLVDVNQPVEKLTVFSDSLDLALNRLNAVAKQIEGRDICAWGTLQELQNFRYFIATNSKISIWAILIRVIFSPELVNLAPFELRDQFESNLCDLTLPDNIWYY